MARTAEIKRFERNPSHSPRFWYNSASIFSVRAPYCRGVHVLATFF